MARGRGQGRGRQGSDNTRSIGYREGPYQPYRPLDPVMHHEADHYHHYEKGMDHFIHEGMHGSYMSKKSFLCYMAMFYLALEELFDEIGKDPEDILDEADKEKHQNQ